MQRRQLSVLACSFLLIQAFSWAFAEDPAKSVPPEAAHAQHTKPVTSEAKEEGSSAVMVYSTYYEKFSR